MDQANIRKILEMALKKRNMGVDKDTLITGIRGMSYDRLKTLCEKLEEDGLADVEWFQNADIVVTINDKGMEYLENDQRNDESDKSKSSKKFQCPNCSAMVDEFVQMCPGCGAEFE